MTAGVAAGEHRTGLVLGVAAYTAWGVVPLYWRELDGIDPIELLACRALFGGVAFAGLAAAMGQLAGAWAALRAPRVLAALAASSALLALNWGLFIHATLGGYLLQASLGYFINPLVSVALGVAFLGERLRRLQLVALALATAGVGWLAVGAGPPWIALLLAGSFGLYGLLRKTAPVAALAGSTAETVLLAPVAAGYLAWIALDPARGAFTHVDPATHGLMVGTGVVTALPLVWFTAAARRLPLTTLGFLQYLAPTGQFLTAVLVLDEPLAGRALAAFAFIWAGLAVFTVDLARAARGRA
ncbi:MAG: EamA family transporter RarD [Kofleriaceae bacterium]|nr:EamA family transporter RarD [Kofleriaceae bacterium]MCL4226850.1 EamA family transporter RarD [Myxococcales bacterium]